MEKTDSSCGIMSIFGSNNERPRIPGDSLESHALGLIDDALFTSADGEQTVENLRGTIGYIEGVVDLAKALAREMFPAAETEAEQ